MGNILVQHQVTINIDITPGSSPTWTRLEGFMDFTEALNEVVQQYFFLDNGGNGETEITGMQPVITMTGIRQFDSDAQNYIFQSTKKYGILQERQTNIQVTYNDGTQTTTIEAPVTFANIQEFSGATTDGTAISVELHFNAAPTVVGGATLALLTVVSIAGTSAGDTAIHVNPLLTGGNSYRYQTGTNLSLPELNQDVSAFASWNGTDDITATTGDDIVIVEVNGSNLAVKAGKATVTSA